MLAEAVTYICQAYCLCAVAPEDMYCHWVKNQHPVLSLACALQYCIAQPKHKVGEKQQAGLIVCYEATQKSRHSSM